MHGWHPGVVRIPNEAWVKKPLDKTALKYDKHESNVFSTTWEPIISQVLSVLDEGSVVIDYSCGTGQFTERLLRKVEYQVSILNVDISPRYLRVAAERFSNDTRVALRLLKKSDDGSRIQSLDEVVPGLVPPSGADVLVSAGAIHLYSNLPDTLNSWQKALRAGGSVFISTGDMYNPKGNIGDLRLHDTIEMVNKIAEDTVLNEPIFEEYRVKIKDKEVMQSYSSLRQRVYPAARSLDFYLDSLEDAGLKPLHCFEEPVNITAGDLVDGLNPYHDVVLGWVGGSRKVEGNDPSEKCLRDRLFLIKYCVEKLYQERQLFQCAWTYLTCRST